MESILTIESLCLSFDDKPVLHDIDLTIPKGEITCIIGPSGCGKTTLLRCINGLSQEDPSVKMQGAICLDGKDVSQLPPDELRRRIGLVFQTPAPFPFSIRKNITYALKYHGVVDKKHFDASVEQALKDASLWDEVKEQLGQNALKLSGGQQQRLCIARALAVKPEILLLDEPCSALDVQATRSIEDLLIGLKGSYTLVVVTHNIAQAKRIADHIVFLNAGRVVEAGLAEQVLECPAQEQTQAFLGGLYG